jgi:hypothetical protein
MVGGDLQSFKSSSRRGKSRLCRSRGNRHDKYLLGAVSAHFRKSFGQARPAQDSAPLEVIEPGYPAFLHPGAFIRNSGSLARGRIHLCRLHRHHETTLARARRVRSSVNLDCFITVSLQVTDSTHFWRKFRGSGQRRPHKVGAVPT